MSYWQFLSEQGPRFVDGTLVTILQFILATVLTIALALVAGFMKLSSNLFAKGVSVVYIELFRGTSLLVQLYWIFFVLPLFGITLEKFTAGIITISLCLGAYGAELVRGAIQSVPQGTMGGCLFAFTFSRQTHVAYYPATGARQYSARMGQSDDRTAQGNRSGVADCSYRSDV